MFRPRELVVSIVASLLLAAFLYLALVQTGNPSEAMTFLLITPIPAALVILWSFNSNEQARSLLQVNSHNVESSSNLNGDSESDGLPDPLDEGFDVPLG